MRPAAGFPNENESEPDAWRPFIAESKPSARAVKQHVLYLINQKQNEDVIALIQAAILEGQAQPWMYEVLAVTMQAAQYPPEEVERVVLSVADFGNASFESMMYSGAYLRNLGHPAAALKMYRQAARLSPERAEPYVLSMKLASSTGNVDDVTWAVCGVFKNAWGVDRETLHEQAEDLLLETEKQLKKGGDNEQIRKMKEAANEARRRDLVIQVQWNGTGDIDLSVEDPAGSVTSYETRESQGGGYLLNDGYGALPNNCHEDFVCPQGFTGEYVIRIKKVDGKVVGNRAVLTIVTHAGDPSEKKVTKTIQFDGTNEHVTRLTLEEGRRSDRRVGNFQLPVGVAADWEKVASRVGRPIRLGNQRGVRKIVAQPQRGQIQVAGGNAPAGAVGFAPGVTIIPEGARLAVRAVVSPDRRYIRMGISPSFTQIIDVATFTFSGGR